MYKRNIIQSLVSIPASDGNFKNALKDATADQLKQAIAQMTGLPDNKKRICACKRQLSRIEGAAASTEAGREPKMIWDEEWSQETEGLKNSLESIPAQRLSIMGPASLRDIRMQAINVAALIEKELLRRGEGF